MTLDAYLSLITSLYRTQPRFLALVTALAQPVVDQQALLKAIRDGFDLTTGIGVQLDQVGEWIGRSRNLETPLDGVYFSWDTEGLGWQQGAWKGPYDPDTGMVVLPDEAYRLLLRAKVAANSWNGTLDDAYAIWEAVFADTGMVVVIQDNQDMSIIVGVAGAYPDAVTKALLSGGYIPLKPAGVEIDHYAVAPQGGALFVWGAESDTCNGWGIGSWPENLIP
jgi:hypothetical protein